MCEVLDIISLIRESSPELQTRIFTEGACYQFYLILKKLFPRAVPFYDGNHVVTYIGGKCYDITGEVNATDRHILMELEPKGWGYKYGE